MHLLRSIVQSVDRNTYKQNTPSFNKIHYQIGTRRKNFYKSRFLFAAAIVVHSRHSFMVDVKRIPYQEKS